MDQLLHDFLPYLRCPVSGLPLVAADPSSLQALNNAIQQRVLCHADGSPVEELLAEALTTEDGQYCYPIIDGRIAALLPTLAIVSKEAQATQSALQSLDAEKRLVQEFYDEYGWQKSADTFKDTATFEDRRGVVADYWRRCHLRLNKYLGQGKYLLDVASGAIPNDEYLTYSSRYQVRICMDFSLLALQEAACKLNNQGIFILGDMTNMPMADQCIDAVISLHTVYHIPRAEQTKAVSEAYRLVRPGGRVVIVYSWKEAPLMRVVFRSWRGVLALLRKKRKRAAMPAAPVGDRPVQPPLGETASPVESRPELFVHQQDYAWFVNDLRSSFRAQLKVYSAISRSFSHTFLREKAFGRQLASLIYQLENLFPGWLGRFGQYPVFILSKDSSTPVARPPLARHPDRVTS